MKLAGILFIVLSAGSVGFRLAISMKNRCNMLRQLLSAMQILQNEIVFCATPLPQAFALAAVSTQGAAERLLSAMARQMDQQRWLSPEHALRQIWETEAELHQETQLLQILLELTAGLGKYDTDSQLRILTTAQERMKQLLAEADQDRSIRSKTYEALGICAGLAMAILLL